MSWERLSVRRSSTPDGPYEGITGHVRGPVVDWLRKVLEEGGGASGIVAMRPLALKTALPAARQPCRLTRCSRCCLSGFFKTRTAFWISSTALCSRWRRTAAAMRLKSYRRYFGSGDRCGQWLRTIKPWCWPSRRWLSSLSTTPPRRRTVSTTLSVAWSNAYGRTPDASDSWDHAIKAVEHVLIPLVAPNQSKPNLGHVVGSLDAQGQLWRWCCRATICLMRRRRSSQCFVSCGRTMTATAVGRRAFRRCRKRARWSRSPSRSCSGSRAKRAVGLARLARSVRSRPSLLDRV